MTPAAEGGAHQSVITPSIGLEQPGCVTWEPAFAVDTEWCLPIPATRRRRRDQVVANGYALRRAEAPVVTVAVMGALAIEALKAADRLAALGHPADVVCVTSPGLVFDAVQARDGHGEAPTWILDVLLPSARATPLVTVLDGHPHTLAFLANVNRVPAVHFGVSRFGQSGDLASVYRYHGIDADGVVAAALDVLERG